MTSTRAARAREKENEVIALRLEGFDFDTIARKVGYRDRSGAWKAYQNALVRQGNDDETFEDAIRLELARLDALQASIFDAAQRGDLAAHDRVLKIMKHRDRLKGYAVAPRSRRGDSDQDDNDNVVVGPHKLDELRAKVRSERAGQ
ncbi:hypothetical protein [Janibacter anophelis]|uniref:hypothetical protein n=1 Tax=Janibacter anophelis TaxID=319054 RepID=UPI000DEFE154|nr:hypothetical protein [Janibacter anophelis]